MSDRFGRRPVLLAGLTLFTLAGIATTAAPNASTLVIARMLQSIGACAGLVLGRAIVRDSAAPDRAAAQLAMLTLVMSAAPAIAPVLGGYATAWFGWRAAFALLAIVGAVTLAFAVLLLPETNRGAVGHARLDAGGLVAAVPLTGVLRAMCWAARSPPRRSTRSWRRRRSSW